MRKPSCLITAHLCLCSSIFPLMARQVTAFNTNWQFRRDPFAADPMQAAPQWDGKWEAAEILHTWNAKNMQAQSSFFYEGAGYYRKAQFFPQGLKDKHIFLRFEEVGVCSGVYVNGKLVGTHKGGYSASACEIGTVLQFGTENEIVVKTDNKTRLDIIPVNQNLFGVYGGIYHPVWLIVTRQNNITVTDYASPGVYITQKNVSEKSADIAVKVKLDNAGLQPTALILENTIYARDGRKISTRGQSLGLTPQGTQTYTSTFKMKDPHLWHGHRDPYLYKTVCKLMADGKVISGVVQPLGVHKCEIVAGEGFFLNGERCPIYDVTRYQDWWGLGGTFKNEHHNFGLATIIDAGATTVRLTHYQQSDYLYSRHDALGLIIWAEIPCINRVAGYEAEDAQNQLHELIRQSFNHPPIYVWGPRNEVYQPHEYTAVLAQSLHDLVKTENPDRYTVSVNGYGHTEHPVNPSTDIQGMNRYFGWYEKKMQDIKSQVEQLERKYPYQKLMSTEYGADTNLTHQTECLGDTLNWGKPFYPETFQTKTHEYQWSVIKGHPYIIASYLWNMFDFAVPIWTRGGVPACNMKGLVTFDHKIKKDSYFWYKTSWSENPVLYLTQRHNVDREKRMTTVTVYSSIRTPKVYLNGEKLGGVRKGHTDVHYTFDNMVLANGKNVPKAVIAIKGKGYIDEVVWDYSGEKNREADSYKNKNGRSGFW